MKAQYLFIFLIFGMFAQQCWAPPPGKRGATGGASAAPDISKCDLNPSKQTKIKVKGKDGKEHFICTGQAICGGKSVPVSCKVSEKEQCPTAKVCIKFVEDYYLPGQVDCDDLNRVNNADKNAKDNVERAYGGPCGGPDGTKGKYVCLKLKNPNARQPIYAFTYMHWQNQGMPEEKPNPYCYFVSKEKPLSCGYCSVNGDTKYWQNDEDIKWATYENPYPPRR